MSDDSTILVSDRERAEDVGPTLGPAPWRFIVGSGLILGLIGWIDVLLLWYPFRLGDAEWEFGTVSATFDALPLATIGLVAVAVAAKVAAGPGVRKLVAGFAIVAAVALLAAAVLFGLSFVQGWGNIPDEASWMLIRAGVKGTLFAMAYTGLYLWLALMLLRSSRR